MIAPWGMPLRLYTRSALQRQLARAAAICEALLNRHRHSESWEGVQKRREMPVSCRKTWWRLAVTRKLRQSQKQMQIVLLQTLLQNVAEELPSDAVVVG